MHSGCLIPVKTWAKCGRTVGEYQAMPPKTRLKLIQNSCMRVDFGYPFMNMQVYGQEKTKRISLKVANVSVLQALHEVNRLCGNWVMFRTEEVVKEKGRVTVDVKNKSVLEVVKECLKGTALGCVEKDGKIIVTVEGVKILRITGLVTDGKAPVSYTHLTLPTN